MIPMQDPGVDVHQNCKDSLEDDRSCLTYCAIIGQIAVRYDEGERQHTYSWDFDFENLFETNSPTDGLSSPLEFPAHSL